MIVDLTKKDLESLVRGAYPDYALFDDPRIKPYGCFSDNTGWRWGNISALSESELWGLYQLCKSSRKELNEPKPKN